jgi:tetratricopeptide (TPR) repeat protein
MFGAHFTEQTGLSMKAFTRATVVLSLALGAVSNAYAANVDWMDVEGRIQYGFYTEDPRALGEVVSQLSGPEQGEDPLLHYYIGLANFRLATLVATKDKTRARQAAARCVSRLDAAVTAKSNFAEGLALQSACLRTLGDLTPWKPLAGPRSSGQMERAAKLAPKDPRVLLLQALESGEEGKLDAPAIATLKKAAAAFEAERQGVGRTPGWGAAEAYAYLGRGYLEQGNVVAARDALERALLIAPDYALARRLMHKITGS